jgi:preprotein translocase subunit Sec61beta
MATEEDVKRLKLDSRLIVTEEDVRRLKLDSRLIVKLAFETRTPHYFALR